MHGPTCIFWANLTPLLLQGWDALLQALRVYDRPGSFVLDADSVGLGSMGGKMFGLKEFKNISMSEKGEGGLILVAGGAVDAPPMKSMSSPSGKFDFQV